MYAIYPIYYPSVRYAKENGELELWQESFKINRECKEYIFTKASGEYRGKNLPVFVRKLAETYGLERAMFIIGRTLINSDWDKRYEYISRERAAQFDYLDMKEARTQYQAGKNPYRTDISDNYLINIHPAVLNAVFKRLMRMEREQIKIPSADDERGNKRDKGAEQ
jgi:hypothetical protein